MKAALSLTLVLALMTPALPATAQEQAETPRSFALPGSGSQATAGPLARAAAREAVRLAAAGEPPSSSIETVQQGGLPVSRTFQELQQRVRRGDTVYVTDDADRTVKAKLTDIWVAGERPELRAALSPSVAPRRDSILMGGLIGFGIGAVLGTTVGAEACLHEPRWHCAVKVGVPIAAIGALIGWLHK